MRLKLCSIFFTILLAGISSGYSQTCTSLGQNPTTAFPVCGTATFTQNTVQLCGGTLVPGPCAFDQVTDINPYWYRFTCYVAGTLSFSITPNILSDDYDWQLFDITGRNPMDVYTDASLFVACNWSGFGGITGTSSTGASLINCGGNTPIFSRMPSLMVGHDYLLLVSHYTPTQSGYQLSFTMGQPGGGTAAITDPANPIPVVTTASVNCDGTQITVHLNKRVKCSTLAANGSDFIISPSGTIVSIAGWGCTTAFDFDSIFISLSAPLAPGNYTIAAAMGTDGNTLLDNCDRPVVVGDDATFTVTPPPPLPMGTVTPPACAPTSLTLTFVDPIKCNSIAANGSDFTITGPSAVTINGATAVNCNANGETNTITIQLSAAILTGGSYQLNIATGSDGNTLIGQCNRQVNNGANTLFTIAPQTPVAMGNVTPPPCTPQSITLTFAEPVSCNSVAANGSDFTITGPSAITITSAAAVNCNATGETTTITIQLSAPILVTGNYTVQMATGTDGNTLTGSCGRQVTAGAITAFTLFPQAAITMGTASVPACAPQVVTLTFTEPIKCNSIAANGSDFIAGGPTAITISAAAAVNCDANGETTEIAIQLTAPILAGGVYFVQMATGTDGNTLLGNCNRQTTAGANAPFIVTSQPAIAMGAVTPPPCTPQSITLTFADPINCNSVAANGSDFIITGASPITVSSATAVNCNANGETTTITIQVSAPILITGNYTIQIATGSDGNTLTGQCNRQVTVGSNTQFALAPQLPIPMGTIPAPNCSPSSITLNFTDNILCNSIAANGSDFIITGPSAVVITGATATCNANGETNAITIQLSNPINISGNFQLQMVAGSDGNTLIGNCNRRTTAGDLALFTIPVASPVPMDSIVPPACSPSSLKLIFAAPIRCSSIAANGSDFIVTGPSVVTVASAAGTCDANGLTTNIDIQLASPVVTGGTYQLLLVAGSDGNTLLSDCNRQTALSQLSFVTNDTVSAEFQYQIQYDCQTDIITFSHDGQHNVNQWTWTVNGTAAGTSQTFTQSFSAASQNPVQLVVSNGLCSDTYSTTIVLNNKVTVAFEVPESACPEDTVVFKNKSTGQIDNWQWTFGNGNTSILQNPPAQIYPLTGTETLYTVSVTASNNNGCQVTATETLKVLSACIIAVPSAFTPNNDGKNDYLYPLNALKAENLDFKVFNRWGQLIFHSKDWRQKWDGRMGGVMQATGVYIWMLDFTHKDTKIKYSMKGTTTLIR
jgi:gliding motility-associated-like protein